MATNNIKVAIKVRPLISREKKTRVEEQWTVTQNSIVSLNPLPTITYHFDHVFGKESSNRDVFEKIAHPIVRQSLEGFNGTIFAYGQTSSGKTHTMLGNDADPGITVLAVRQLFEENESDRTFMIRVGYIEIYNEKVFDLLADRKSVTINQNGENDVKLTNREEFVSDGEHILTILNSGNKLRKAAQTNMNEASSRSHAIFRIIIESEDTNGDGPVRVSYLNLVDLAGSEKANDAGTSGARLKEGNDINKSLLHLGMAIRALSEGKKFVDVRSSKLTRILQASLGGNANTAIVCNITPAAIEETASTLGFANQAKTVKNDARCNEVFSPEEALMKQMQAEVSRLKADLQQSNENEKKLKAKIVQKEATFLSGRNMRVKADRRKTWHHMPGENLQPLSMIPRSQYDPTKPKLRSSAEDLLSDISPLMPDTPRELRIQPCATPSPNQVGLKYRLGRMEKEFSDLQHFTALETRFDLYKDTTTKDSYIEKLEKDLKFAREEVEKYRNLTYGDVVNGTGNSNGMIETAPNDDKLADSSVLHELATAKDQNNQLMQQLAQLQSAHEKEKEILDQKCRAAKHCQEKAEILQAEGEITLGQYKKQTNQRINELISEVESLKVHSIAKPADLNISKMPIKVEPESSYELTELKYDLDQLKHDQERNKKITQDLELQIQALTEERSLLRSENSEVSTRSNKIIKELESQLEFMTEERNVLLSDRSERSGSNSKIIEDFELQVQALTDEKSLLRSEHSELSTHNHKIIENLEVQVKALAEERSLLRSENSESSARNNKIIKDLESRLDAMTEELNVQQSEHAEKTGIKSKIIEDLELQVNASAEEARLLRLENLELSARNNKIIKDMESQLEVFQSEKSEISTREIVDLKSQLETLAEEKNNLQLEHSDLSEQIMEYIEDLDQMKSKLDAMENVQARFDDLQKMYDSSCAEVDKLQTIVDENLQVIEKTEEECKTFKTSLLESYDKIKISMEETELLNARNSSLCVEVSNLKNSLNTQSSEVNDLKKKMQELQQQNVMLCSEREDDENVISQVEKLQEKHCAEIAVKEEELQKLTERFQSDVEHLQTELQQKKQLSDAFNANIAALETEIREKQDLVNDSQTIISKLKSELNDRNEQQSNDLKMLKMELQEKQRQAEKFEEIITESNQKFQNELLELKREKQHQVVKYETMISDLNEKFQTELLDWKSELAQKKQLLDNNEEIISDLNKKFQTESLELKAELKKQHQQVVSDLKLELNQKFQNQLLEVNLQLKEKQELVDNNDSLISHLKNDLSKSKAEMRKKQQEVEKYEAMNSDLNIKFQNELLELKAELTVNKQQVDKNEQIIAQLKSELIENNKNALSAKNVIATLESQLRSQLPDDAKRSPPKVSNAKADRKSRRHSQHDESRLWWEDTLAPTSSVETQTDPSDENCSCESMNLKIQELKQAVKVKEAKVNIQKLHILNHPSIGENNDLKRALHDKQAEVQLLHLDVEHYKGKLQQAIKSRECSCRSKVMENKEVQVDCDTDFANEQPAANGQNGVSNGLNEENLSNLQKYCIYILPVKYQTAKREIEKLKEDEAVKAKQIAALQGETKAITKKANLYKELAVSRRAEIKKFEAKMAVSEKSANVSPEIPPASE